jgi:hypothetical protein
MVLWTIVAHSHQSHQRRSKAEAKPDDEADADD